MEQEHLNTQNAPQTDMNIGEGAGCERIPQNENIRTPRPAKPVNYVRMAQQLFSRTIALFKDGPTYSKKRLAIGAIAALIILPVLYSFILVPRMSYYKHHSPTLTNFMKYRMWQAEKRGNSFTARYTFIPLREISPSLLRAVIYAEDSKFYQHHGVDWASIMTSFTQNIKRHRIVWGGSTITQQLCKNMFLYPKKTLWRKYLELILTWRIEHTLSKPRILELYLNVIEWGPGIFGAENAAQYYFNKSACFLDDEEASLLAAIIMAPRSYKKDKPNPFFEARQQWVYSFMTTGEVTEPTADMFFDFTIDPELPLGDMATTPAGMLTTTADLTGTDRQGDMTPSVSVDMLFVSGNGVSSADRALSATGDLQKLENVPRKRQRKLSVDN